MNNNSAKTTGEIIEEALKNGGFTYRKLAKASSIDHAYLYNIVKGKKCPPSTEDFYKKLGEVLDLVPADFLEYRRSRVLEYLDNNIQSYEQLFNELINPEDSETATIDRSGNIKKIVGVFVDNDAYQVQVDGNILDLTSKEFGLLSYLYNNEDRILTREALLREVWGFNYFGGTRTVDVHIRRLRAKLEPRYQDTIETVRNIGYRFRKPQ